MHNVSTRSEHTGVCVNLDTSATDFTAMVYKYLLFTALNSYVVHDEMFNSYYNNTHERL